MKEEVFVVTTIILQLMAAAVNGIITTSPTDISVCYGGRAPVHCESDRNDISNIQWHFSPDDLSLQERGVSIDTNITSEYATSTLSIIGLPVNDGIDIVCTAITSSFDTDSESALLTVSDIPPVEHLTIEFNNTAMNVTWSVPSCLPVYYTYSITITDDSNQTQTTNTTDPLYTMPVWSNCTTNYTVSVTVIDTGYTHKQSVLSVGNKTRNNTEVYVEFLQTELVFSDVYLSYVDVTFKIHSSCNERPIRNIFIELVQPVNNRRMVPLLEFADEETYSGKYSTDNFDKRFLGNLSISLTTNDGRFSTIDISTFNVQNLTVSNEAHNGSIVITCVFATNSSADGCNVTIQSSQYYTSIVIQKKEYEKSATNETVIPEEGVYNFQGFDIVGGDTDISEPAVSMSKHISYLNADNQSGFNDNHTSTSSFSISESTTTTFFPIQPSSTIVVSNVESSTVIIAGVGSVIVISLLLSIFGFVVFIIRHRRKKGAFDARQGQAVVRIYGADNNEYTVDASVSVKTYNVPVTAQTTHQQKADNVIAQSTQENEKDDFITQSTQQNEDLNPYHVSRNDFLRVIPPVESDSDYNSRISPSTSNQERHFELFQNSNFSFDSYPSRYSSTTSINISTSNDPTQSEPRKQDFSHHIYSNTKSLNGKQSTLPYENIPPKHRHISSVSATDQQSATMISRSVPAGPMLDKSQYAELASNTQRPRPTISDPQPLYSTIVPTCDTSVRMTMNSSQCPEKEKPIAMQETRQDTNSTIIGLPVNLDSYNGMIFAGSVAKRTTEDDYSHDTATTVFIENEEKQELSLHRITSPTNNKECDDRDGLVPNTPNSSGTQMITQLFQSPFVNTYQKKTQTLSCIWDDQLHVHIINDTDIRDIDMTECYSDVDASHSQMVYLLNNDYVKRGKSSDLIVFSRSRTIFEDDAIEDHQCIEVVSIGVKDSYSEEEESERNVTVITAAFEKRKPSFCKFIQGTLAFLTCELIVQC